MNKYRGQFGLVNFLVWLVLFLVVYSFLPFINSSFSLIDSYTSIPTSLKLIFSLAAATLIFAVVYTPISYIVGSGGGGGRV